jgi:hypothetical protein
MIGEKLYQLVVLAFMLGTLTFSTVAQQPAVNAPATRGIALEVMYAKGRSWLINGSANGRGTKVFEGKPTGSQVRASCRWLQFESRRASKKGS